jgi:hypothetical protein
VLQTTQAMLQAQAEAIGEAGVRRMFLECVPENRELVGLGRGE